MIPESIDPRAERLRAAIIGLREGAAATRVASERVLWSLPAFDERAEALRFSLVERRVALDARRRQLVAARENVERLKSVARLVIRTLELRRAIGR